MAIRVHQSCPNLARSNDYARPITPPFPRLRRHRPTSCISLRFEVTLRDFHDEVIAGLSLANAPIWPTMIDDFSSRDCRRPLSRPCACNQLACNIFFPWLRACSFLGYAFLWNSVKWIQKRAISNDRNNVCTRYIKGWISAATATTRKSEPGHLWSRVKSKFSPCMAWSFPLYLADRKKRKRKKERGGKQGEKMCRKLN